MRPKFCRSILNIVMYPRRRQTLPSLPAKTTGFVTNEQATALIRSFIDRFWLAWHFASVTSNQATGTESANSSTDPEQTNYRRENTRRMLSNELFCDENVIRLRWDPTDGRTGDTLLPGVSLEFGNVEFLINWRAVLDTRSTHQANEWCQCSHVTCAAAFCFVSPTHSIAWYEKELKHLKNGTMYSFCLRKLAICSLVHGSGEYLPV